MTTTDEGTPDATAGDNVPAVDVPISQALAEFRDYVNGLAAVDDDDVTEKILKAILKATTPAEILNAGGAVPADQLLGVPMRVERIRASESTYVEGNDFYLHVDAVILGNKDEVTFSCGSQDVCVKLVQLARHNFLPCDVILERATKATKKGYFPTFLRALDEDRRPF